ncbi:SDR family oxidoreductase [Periweissella cryptocerci]|nr:aldehyde reductase [Periweissella cryptocerci]
MTNKTVLVTGGTGYIAQYIMAQLLNAGYNVRTTVRSLARKNEIQANLREAGAHNTEVELIAADLTADLGWAEAMNGVDYVMHVASPMIQSKNEDDLIIPAQQGTLRVLNFANAAGVKRVIMTSAFGAIGMGRNKKESNRVFTENDWAPVNSKLLGAYYKSKTLAEKAAWDFVNQPATKLELATILPVAVFGPILGGKTTGSNHLLAMMLGGKTPAVPDIWIPVSDVRDIANAHILAMTTPEAAGERFIISHESSMPMKAIGQILKDGLGEVGKKVPTKQIPTWLIKLIAPLVPIMRQMLPDIGIERKMSSANAKNILHWQPQYSINDTLIESAQVWLETHK